jgi:Peptidase A4 family
MAAGPVMAPRADAVSTSQAAAGSESAGPATHGPATRHSRNWAGYALIGAKHREFVGVEGQWYVPTVTTTKTGSQRASDWIGIDGASNKTVLVQVGTRSESINGKAVYYAWTEILPHGQVKTRLVVHPGDLMSAEVLETAPNVWNMSITDARTNAGASRTVSYTTPGQDAEAIHERVGTLAQTKNVWFMNIQVFTGTITNPVIRNLGSHVPGATLNEIFMTNNRRSKVIAAPSVIRHLCFAVADGSKSPSPPPPNAAGCG